MGSMSITKTAAVGTLSLVAAGIIGGGFALALSQGAPQQPVQLRQVVSTETAMPNVTTTTTATPEPTATTSTTSTTSGSKAPAPKLATRLQQVAPEPTVSETTPEPAATTPEPAPRAPSPIKPGPGTLVTATCGGAGCPTPAG